MFLCIYQTFSNLAKNGKKEKNEKSKKYLFFITEIIKTYRKKCNPISKSFFPSVRLINVYLEIL